MKEIILAITNKDYPVIVKRLFYSVLFNGKRFE
jgi:hypothetical protein